jgi:hypothetical protein
MAVRKPTWSTSSFVLYTGGLAVLGAAAGGLAYLSAHYGDAAFVAWTLLPLAVLYAVAHWFRARGEWTAAGLFIVADMVVWILFLAALENWWGWLPDGNASPFDGWHWGLWLIVVVAIATAFVDLRQFRFPLLVVFPPVLAWYLFVDLLSGGGDWSAALTLLVGLVYLAIGTQLGSRPYGFWIHVVSGLLVGGALLYWWHTSEADWALVATAGVAYVGLARATGRSSWAVLGVLGFLAATTHWVIEWSRISGFLMPNPARGWVAPLVYGIVGLFFVLLGIWARGRPEELAT